MPDAATREHSTSKQRGQGGAYPLPDVAGRALAGASCWYWHARKSLANPPLKQDTASIARVTYRFINLHNKRPIFTRVEIVRTMTSQRRSRKRGPVNHMPNRIQVVYRSRIPRHK